MDTERYSVGWIAPLPLEETAAVYALEHDYGDIQVGRYNYRAGKIGPHYVVIGVQSRIGTDGASHLAARMQTAFPNIEYFLVVGIGGGVPRYGPTGAISEMVLGDVVVSSPRGRYGGVVRYDVGAWEGEEGRLNVLSHTNSPPESLLAAVKHLQVSIESGQESEFPSILDGMRLKVREEKRHEFEDQGVDNDVLFFDDTPHPTEPTNVECRLCCNLAKSQQRSKRGDGAIRQRNAPKVHYGNIASSNQLQISAIKRNEIQKEFDAICFEMEGAGVIQSHPSLIIRGICDYSDSHKNKIWQPYAALTAAAYAKLLLDSIPANRARHVERDTATSEQMQRKHDFLSRLRSTDPRDDKKRIEETKGGLLEESYRWVLQTPDFINWSSDPHSRLLWIKGDPGKGKTMLLCGILNELEKSKDKTRLISFFFCQATDSRLNSATAVLRGLIYMLIDQCPSLISHVPEKYDHAGKDLFNDTNSWIALNDVFAAILKDLGNAYLVIDALDECVTDLKKLVKVIVQSSSASSQVKWIVSSRNEPEIERILRLDNTNARLSLELKSNAEYVAHAVNLYIEDCVAKLSEIEGDQSLQSEVKTKIRSKANGTFLWVSLVIKQLEDVRRWDILDVIDDIPEELKEVYHRMLALISRRQRNDPELCRQVLAAVITAYRPLKLQELYVLAEFPRQIRSQDTEEIVRMCGSFLTLRDDNIYLIHQSATDFLVEEQTHGSFFRDMGDTHYSMFSRSLQVMSKTLKKDIYGLVSLGYPAERIQTPEPDPLAESSYSIIYWIDHLCDLNLDCPSSHASSLQDGGLLDKFLRGYFLYWIEALSILKSMSKGIISMARLEALLVQHRDRAILTIQTRQTVHRIAGDYLEETVKDAHRFIRYYRTPIEHSPLQAYTSALIFSPQQSLIKKHFEKEEEPKWLNLNVANESHWSACVQTLEGHRSWILSLALSDDSTRVASTSGKGVVKIWDTSSGECIQTFETIEARNRIHSTTVSRCFTRLAVSHDSAIAFWDMSTGECIQCIQKTEHSPESMVSSLHFINDANQLLSGDQKGTILTWDVDTGRCLGKNVHPHDVNETIQFSHNLETYLTYSETHGVRIWDARTRRCIQTIDDKPIRQFDKYQYPAFSPDATHIALQTGADSVTSVKVWKVGIEKWLRTLEGHDSRIFCIRFSHDATRIALAYSDRILEIWDVRTGACSHTLRGHSHRISSLEFSRDSTRLVSGSSGATVKIWDLGNAKLTQEPGIQNNELDPPLHNYSQIALTSRQIEAKVANESQENDTQALEHHSNGITALALSHNSELLVSASLRDTIKLWDVTSGRCLETIQFASVVVHAVTFSHIITKLAFGLASGQVWIWNQESRSFGAEHHKGLVRSVSFSPNSELLASAGDDRCIRIWDVNRCVYTQVIEADSDHSTIPLSVVFSRDSMRLVSAGDKSIKVWNANTGELLETLATPDFETVLNLAFSPNSTHLASVSERGNLRLWDMSTHKTAKMTQTFGFSSLSFDSIGSRLYTPQGAINIEQWPDYSSDNYGTQTYGLFSGIGISKDLKWITYNGENVLWLPSEYRPGFVAVSENVLCIGPESGKVLICRVDPEKSYPMRDTRRRRLN